MSVSHRWPLRTPPDDLEVVVVDDGSTDDTAKVIQTFATHRRPVVYVHQEHRGIPAARNAGLERSRGKLVSFVADDYLLPQDYVSAAVRFLGNTPHGLAQARKLYRFNDGNVCPHRVRHSRSS